MIKAILTAILILATPRTEAIGSAEQIIKPVTLNSGTIVCSTTLNGGTPIGTKHEITTDFGAFTVLGPMLWQAGQKIERVKLNREWLFLPDTKISFEIVDILETKSRCDP